MTTDFQTGADHMTAPAAPVRLICIGTHHKTGTLWMRWVFRAMCYKLGLPFDFGKTATADEGRNVIAHWSSDFAPETLSRAIAQDYAETFGADLVALGYETHPTDWVQETRL